jgi:hypothetical protein
MTEILVSFLAKFPILRFMVSYSPVDKEQQEEVL